MGNSDFPWWMPIYLLIAIAWQAFKDTFSLPQKPDQKSPDQTAEK